MNPGTACRARAVRHLPHLLRGTVSKAWQDRVLGLSAEAAFWQLLSLPSMFLALVATLGYVSRWFGVGTVDRTETQIENTMGHAFSKQVVTDVIHPMIHEILHGGRADVISIGFVIALWAGSSATATFVNTITIAYGMRDMRGAVRSRLLALWLFLGSVLIGVVLLPLLVLGPDLLGATLPHSSTRHTAEHADRRRLLPDRCLPAAHRPDDAVPPRAAAPAALAARACPGAILAMLIFLGGASGLRSYINFILDHNHAYGTLAAPIAALLFFFVLALGVLLGAEFNAAIEQPRSPARSSGGGSSRDDSLPPSAPNPTWTVAAGGRRTKSRRMQPEHAGHRCRRSPCTWCTPAHPACDPW